MTRTMTLLGLLAILPTSACWEPEVEEETESETTTEACDDERAAGCQDFYEECVLFGGEPEDCQFAIIEYFECPDLDYIGGEGDACGDSEVEEPGFIDVDCTTPDEFEGFDATARAIHVSPDAPAVDVYMNRPRRFDNIGPDLSFGMAYPYRPIQTFVEQLSVYPAGTPANDILLGDPEIFFRGDIAIEASCYTAVVYDRLDTLDVLLLEDDFSPVRKGTIRLRAVHTAPSVGAVDVYDVTDAGRPARVESGLELGTAGGSLELPADAFSLGLDVDFDGVADLVFDVPALEEGSVVNAFVTEDPLGDITVLAQLDSGSVVRIDPR